MMSGTSADDTFVARPGNHAINAGAA